MPKRSPMAAWSTEITFLAHHGVLEWTIQSHEFLGRWGSGLEIERSPMAAWSSENFYLDPDVLERTIQARHQELLHRRGGGRQAGQNAHQWRCGAVIPSRSYSWERAFISLIENNTKLDFLLRSKVIRI
jgi:hypothetical protein